MTHFKSLNIFFFENIQKESEEPGHGLRRSDRQFKKLKFQLLIMTL